MRFVLAPFVLGLATLTSAQNYLTSPPGYLTKNAGGSSTYFGGDSFGRVMFLDGEVGNSATVVKEVAYRPEGSSTGARTWSSISLRVSHCDVDKASTTFSANPTSTPVLVFSSSMTWPALTGNGWNIRFPFSTPWTFTGTNDICLDYDFEGGTLHGQSIPWWKLLPEAYQLDGFDVSSLVTGTATYYGQQNCRDSRGITNSFRLYFDAYGPSYSVPALRDKFRLAVHAITGPSAPSVFVVGSAGIPNGFAFPGVTCGEIYVDFSKPVTFFLRTADQYGQVALWPSPNSPLIPYDSALSGTVVWAQAAWNDTGNGSLLFTKGGFNTVPRLPKMYRRTVLSQPDNLQKYGTGIWRPAHFYPTVARFTK